MCRARAALAPQKLHELDFLHDGGKAGNEDARALFRLLHNALAQLTDLENDDECDEHEHDSGAQPY